MMNPEAVLEIEEDRQEAEIRPKGGGDVSNRAAAPQSEEDKDALIASLLKEIEELKAKSAVLEALEAKSVALDKKRSVQELLRVHHGIPRMEKNTAAKPSVGSASIPRSTQKRKEPESKRRAAEEASKKISKIIIDEESDSEEQQHLPAEIKKMKEEVTACLNKFEVNLKDPEGDLIKSKVAVELAENSTNEEAELHHFNEASVSRHVSDVLHDVLQCLQMSLTTKIGQEISLFSMRPDIVVVRWKCRIILVIEVKNPGENGKAVVSNSVAAGQAYDYAMGLQQMGIDHPFVCLSTYDYMGMGTLKASSLDIFHHATELLASGPIGKAFDSTIGTNKPKASPEEGKPTEVPVDYSLTDVRDMDATQTRPTGTNRVIYFSEIFERSNMFQALYFAVACGIVAVEHSKNDRKENLVPLEGERVTTRTIAVVQENSLSWEKHKCRATYQLKRAWRTNLKVYLHCVLGQGCSGKVYLGSDSAGRMFAVKLYLFDAAILESFRAIDNEKTKKTQKQRAARVRDSEAEKWKNFYPSYKEAIYQGELFGVPCLAMPYVASIPMNRRKVLLPKIEKELKRLSNKGFAYTDRDLRWRHIGLRKDRDDGDDKIVLVDLESMKPRRKDDEAHTDHVYLQSAIKELKDRAEEERVRAPQELIHA